MDAPRGLTVVARRPEAGRAKTRLCPPLDPVQAAELYECFLLDTLDLMRAVPGVARFVAYEPADQRDYFRRIAPDFGLLAQEGSSLGERLDNALARCLEGGCERAIVMGSDSPTLPVAYVKTAFELLEEADVVLGPTEDGGYYLIGLKRPQPGLLREVRMSTPRVLADTLALAEQAGLRVALAPSWYDVDTATDLRRLRAELRGAAAGVATRTRRFLTVE